MAAFLSLLRRLYLTTYNWILFAGWFQVLFLTLKTLKEPGHAHVYSNIQKPLLFAQTAALLEVKPKSNRSKLLKKRSTNRQNRNWFETQPGF
ncbi:putative very-long-chain (3R)-3-hydroxyacyl-CoA dehydratase [Helianthus annuus]|nr:putative very-long-chain (3R)-3-hydroxyacyl-CoA dehydratase [Helianthus annuus]KAJ0562936.1 putative very-long-chain (3R)-3-hydroxyacyl-CoA dehydratase [Helianthus annuus]KAJ0728302.1 putative very-long-chain (3R)-3-hydroxyacyl-CoA dehydratase [Helianthus annuus]KAJ0731072.1 putative very-long-chain (3R)-3-hydroxyacyl-CoA dehydratase [Helianthus annuus]